MTPRGATGWQQPPTGPSTPRQPAITGFGYQGHGLGLQQAHNMSPQQFQLRSPPAAQHPGFMQQHAMQAAWQSPPPAPQWHTPQAVMGGQMTLPVPGQPMQQAMQHLMLLQQQQQQRWQQAYGAMQSPPSIWPMQPVMQPFMPPPMQPMQNCGAWPGGQQWEHQTPSGCALPLAAHWQLQQQHMRSPAAWQPQAANVWQGQQQPNVCNGHGTPQPALAPLRAAGGAAAAGAMNGTASASAGGGGARCAGVQASLRRGRL